jgi:uncharacterized protein with NRDE domain
MCILMAVHNRVRDYPIVLAANRDEYMDRPAQEPAVLRHCPTVWGGRDLRAGGTWLGMNQFGLVVGLTNRRLSAEQTPDPTCRSRGLLCLEVLQKRVAREVAAHLEGEPANRYNPFNLLVMDHDEAYWIAYDHSARSQALHPGLHILANGNINDFETVRIRRARQLLESSASTDLASLLPLLERVCRDHEQGVQDRETICMHRPQKNYGTVSSTIFALPSAQRRSLYWYADGPPCTTPYEDYSFLLADFQVSP